MLRTSSSFFIKKWIQPSMKYTSSMNKQRISCFSTSPLRNEDLHKNIEDTFAKNTTKNPIISPIIPSPSAETILQSTSTSAFSTTTTMKNTSKIIDFSDTSITLKTKSFYELLRGYLVFRVCQNKFLVENSENLLKFSYKYFGMTLTNFILKFSFFGHFCAGENENLIVNTVNSLHQVGVGSILDYAAEADIEETSSNENENSSMMMTVNQHDSHNQGRVYDYKNEELCDYHMETFLRAIRAVHNVSPTGFAAIKVTALGNPELLRRISTTLVGIRSLFHRMDTEQTGFVTREQILEVFGTVSCDGKDILSHFDHWDTDSDGKIDYVEWTNHVSVDQLHLVTQHCTTKGPVAASVLNEQELELYAKMRERLYTIAELAQRLQVRLMVDAEHTYFQPAIDHLTNELSCRYNAFGSFPVIFGTYQMYLKDSRRRLLTDMGRARAGNYRFAAKLVRGAYMVLERRHALDNGMDDPIHNTIEDTHANYNGAVREAISRIANGDDVEIMIASHNQGSVETALAAMAENNLPPSVGVYFGQLLGMSDYLTLSLGARGYKAYKYVPYGKINEVMPYLIRRAQENSDALSGAKLELNMLSAEIKRRIFGK